MKKINFIGNYLDVLRVLSASMVVLFHLKLLEVGPPALLRRLPGFGHEFVIVFFVLSGYVISWSADRKRGTLGLFALDRAARILSVSIPLLLLSTAVSAALSMGDSLQMVEALFANLVFLGQSWGIDSFPASNPPFWSLNYEVWYYVVFGCAYYLRGKTRVVACILACALAGPRVLLLLPCWLLGAAIYFAPQKLGRAAGVVAVASVLVLLALSALKVGARIVNPATGFELGQSRTYAKDWVTAFFVAVHIYAMRHFTFRIPEWFSTAATRGAAVTFTLYLVNYPMILIAKSVFGHASATLACTLLAVVLVCCCTWLLAMLTEAHTKRVRDWMIARASGPTTAT